MVKNMKKLLVILLAALMLVSLSACEIEIENTDIKAVELDKKEVDDTLETALGIFKYEYIESSTLRIVSYTTKGEAHDLVIPAEMNGKTVVEIGEGAFYSDSTILSVDVPNTVKKIGDVAFACCESMKWARVPASVADMGIDTFYGCTGLESVEFSECENAALTEIGFWAFGECTALKNINVPASVTKIEAGAFFNCEALENVVFADAANWFVVENRGQENEERTAIDVSTVVAASDAVAHNLFEIVKIAPAV